MSPTHFFGLMHLYVHIPFCHRICPYCAFFKHTPGATDMRGFVRAVGTEAALRLPVGAAPETLYFGGGTPGMLSPTHLEALVQELKKTVDLSRLKEWSFEANPVAFGAEKARQWRRLGITRVSLGVQSLDKRMLEVLGRRHTPESVAESVRFLRSAGIPQVNIDLMFGVPGQTVEMWEETLDRALELQPDHISTYNLTYEEGTPFYEQYGPQTVDEEQDVAMFETAERILCGAGFRHYEVSNYARNDDCISLHNMACWMGEDYYGLGPGACGTVNMLRTENAGDTPAYIAALSRGELPPGTSEVLSAEQRRTELVGLWLRTDVPLPVSFLSSSEMPFVQELVREGLATFSPELGLSLTRRGRLLTDEIAVGLV